MQVKIPKDLVDRIKDKVNTDLELAGWILALKEKDMLKFWQMTCKEFEVYSADISEIPLSLEWMNKAQGQPYKFEIIPTHSHSVKYGEIILPEDVYLSNQDKEVIKKTYPFFKKYNIDVNKSAFIHPRKGSEGRRMSPDLVDITCIEFDPNKEVLCRLPVIIDNSFSSRTMYLETL